MFLRTVLLTSLALLVAVTFSGNVEAQQPVDLQKGPPTWAQAGKHGISAIESEFDTSGPETGAQKIRIELPDGGFVILQRDGYEKRGSGKFTWRGREESNPDSRATLTVHKGLVFGSLQIGADIYEISPQRGRKIKVELLNPASFPACDIAQGKFSGAVPEDSPNPGAEPPNPIAEPPAPKSAGDESLATIDLLSVYTAAARTTAGGTTQMEIQIQAAIDGANTAFIDSDMIARFRLVHTVEVSHVEAATSSDDLNWVTSDAGVGAIRDAYGADMVSLIVDRAGFCGVGWVQRNPSLAFESSAFQVTDIGCLVGNRTLAHEHGHNMGFEHNPENSSATPATASYPWSFAHYVNGQFRTIMSYSNQCANGCTRVGHWSNPDIDYLGIPTGTVDVNGESVRDNARSGDSTAPICELFRSTVVPPDGVTIENVSIASGSDDVEEMVNDSPYLDAGYVYGSSNDMDMTTDINYGSQIIGLRFLDLDIPWGSTVTSSYLRFTSYFTDSATGDSLVIRAEDSDSAAAFVTGQTNNVSSRAPTTEMVNWGPPAWPFSFESKFTPDMSAVIQEVIDRPGWLPDNEMAFMVTGSGVKSAAAFEAGPEYAAQLHVEFRSCSESQVLPGEQWVQFSLPCTPKNNTVADVFSGLDPSPGEYIFDWIVYTFDSAINQYVYLQPTDTMEGNRGYWFLKLGADYTLTLDGKENRDNVIPLEGSATGRFNLVGHPPRTAIPWKDVIVMYGGSDLSLDQADPDIGGGVRICDSDPTHATCILSHTMQQWNGSAHIPYDGETPGMEGTLSTFEGLWVKAYKSGVSLKVPETPITPAMGTDEDNSRAAKYRNGDPWFVRLVVESGDAIDPGNVFGQLETAYDGQDKHDLKELSPFGSPWLSITFPHEDWEGSSWGFTSDYRAMSKKPQGSWRFVVRASEDITDAMLTWQGPAEIIRKAKLVNEQTGKKVNIKADGSYWVDLSEGDAWFRFEL